MVIKICEASKQCYWSSLKAKSTPVWKKYATAGNDGSDYYELCICFFILLVNPTRKIVCSVADTFHVEIFDNSLHIRGGQVTCVVSLISLHPTTGILRYTFFGPRSDQSLRQSMTHCTAVRRHCTDWYEIWALTDHEIYWIKIELDLRKFSVGGGKTFWLVN